MMTLPDVRAKAERLLANRRGYAGVALRDLDMEAAVESLLAELQRVAQERDALQADNANLQACYDEMFAKVERLSQVEQERDALARAICPSGSVSDLPGLLALAQCLRDDSEAMDRIQDSDLTIREYLQRAEQRAARLEAALRAVVEAERQSLEAQGKARIWAMYFEPFVRDLYAAVDAAPAPEAQP